MQGFLEVQIPKFPKVAPALRCFSTFARRSVFHVQTDCCQVVPESCEGTLSACHPASALWCTEECDILSNNVTDLFEAPASFGGTVVEAVNIVDALFYGSHGIV